MAMLADLARDAQDPAYAEAARRRAIAGDAAGSDRPPAHPAGRRALAMLALGVLGLLTGTAAAAVRSAATGDAAARSQLVGQVRTRTAESDALQARAAALRTDVESRRNAALLQGALGRQRATELAALELAAATVPVSGPGVVVVIGDRPKGKTDAPAQQRGGRPGDGRVLDRDLQDLVNGLWLAGAEAITVNDQRLTVQTAIRSAGEAILVDFRPLSPPYTVRAIGGPDLETGFADGVAGRRLATYTSLYGLPFTVGAAASLTLAAGSSPDLVGAR